MPLLSYSSISDYPFQPFSKIYSADLSAMFATIQTLLNTTKLDMTNMQTQVLTRNGSSSVLTPGSANYVVFNDSSGNLTEAAQLSVAQGGTGLSIVPASQSPGDVLQVNSTSTALTMGPPTGVPSSLRVFQFYNFS